MKLLVMVVLAATKLATYSDDALHGAFPAGCDGKGTVCEASGSKAARAVNMLHFRLDQAQKAQKAKAKEACQAEAQAAVALSQGLPKFRAQLQASRAWGAGKSYQTRWDGTLAEDQAFVKVAAMGEQAKKLFAECGGKKLSITDADEQAFVTKVNPADLPVSLDNRDHRQYDFEVTGCPNGSSSRGAIVSMGGANLGGGLEGCTLQLTGAGSVRLKGGTTCTISSGQLLCK